MSRPKLRSASKKVAEGKITKLVSDSEALEVARPGRIRNILPACRLNVQVLMRLFPLVRNIWMEKVNDFEIIKRLNLRRTSQSQSTQSPWGT